MPNLPRSSVGSDRRPFDEAIKERLDLLAGQRGVKVKELPPTAGTSEIIDKVNELIRLLQG
ncbi:hypothetical protein [Roseateles sp.]|uniref:hypothetical protein n=1 Tax=Roseateles sp. TaxID=1971397 RepID=UPI002E081F94|nr:hypothetical protein [Roseateles sp.]